MIQVSFFRLFFLRWTIFEDFFEFVATLLLVYVLFFLATSCGMWNLSSLTRDQT